MHYTKNEVINVCTRLLGKITVAHLLDARIPLPKIVEMAATNAFCSNDQCADLVILRTCLNDLINRGQFHFSDTKDTYD